MPVVWHQLLVVLFTVPIVGARIPNHRLVGSVKIHAELAPPKFSSTFQKKSSLRLLSKKEFVLSRIGTSEKGRCANTRRCQSCGSISQHGQHVTAKTGSGTYGDRVFVIWNDGSYAPGGGAAAFGVEKRSDLMEVVDERRTIRVAELSNFKSHAPRCHYHTHPVTPNTLNRKRVDRP